MTLKFNITALCSNSRFTHFLIYSSSVVPTPHWLVSKTSVAKRVAKGNSSQHWLHGSVGKEGLCVEELPNEQLLQKCSGPEKSHRGKSTDQPTHQHGLDLRYHTFPEEGLPLLKILGSPVSRTISLPIHCTISLIKDQWLRRLSVGSHPSVVNDQNVFMCRVRCSTGDLEICSMQIS